MVFVKDFPDVLEIFVVLGFLEPRDFHEGFDITHDEGGFQRRLRHHRISIQLVLNLLLDVFRIGVFFQFFANRIDALLRIGVFPEFGTDRLHLFAQDVLPLALLGGFAHFLVNGLIDLGVLSLRFEMGLDILQAGGDIDFLKQLLPFGGRQRQNGRQGIGEFIPVSRAFREHLQSAPGNRGRKGFVRGNKRDDGIDEGSGSFNVAG